jgi:hypothetical protein
MVESGRMPIRTRRVQAPRNTLAAVEKILLDVDASTSSPNFKLLTRLASSGQTQWLTNLIGLYEALAMPRMKTARAAEANRTVSESS